MSESYLAPPRAAAAGATWQLFTGVTLTRFPDVLDGATLLRVEHIADGPPYYGLQSILYSPNTNPNTETHTTGTGTGAWSFAGITRFAQFRLFVNHVPDQLLAVEPNKDTGFPYGTIAAPQALTWVQDGRVSPADSIYPAWTTAATTFFLDGLAGLDPTLLARQGSSDGALHLKLLKVVGDVWVEVRTPTLSPPPPATTYDGLTPTAPAFQVDWPRVEQPADVASATLTRTGALTWARQGWAGRPYLLYARHTQLTVDDDPPAAHDVSTYTFVKLPGRDDAGALTVAVVDLATVDGSAPVG